MVAAPNVFTRWIASWRRNTIKRMEGILYVSLWAGMDFALGMFGLLDLPVLLVRSVCTDLWTKD